ncbi:MAG TPA: hypothetical protein VNK52_04450 [Hyphomicrobiaceae bacterium]|nr:hypothetical protein [Hyphomicrobiaceae bacterium]
MRDSAFIARLIGPLLLVNALAILINRKGFQEMISGATRNPAVIYFAGLLTLLAGLTIVEFHNVWTLGWPLIITLIGWLAIVGGIARTMFPARMAAIGESMVLRERLMVGGAVVSALVGGFLTIRGYNLTP